MSRIASEKGASPVDRRTPPEGRSASPWARPPSGRGPAQRGAPEEANVHRRGRSPQRAPGRSGFRASGRRRLSEPGEAFARRCAATERTGAITAACPLPTRWWACATRRDAMPASGMNAPRTSRSRRYNAPGSDANHAPVPLLRPGRPKKVGCGELSGASGNVHPPLWRSTAACLFPTASGNSESAAGGAPAVRVESKR
jgi:hypothetical protein